jgi:hypothetical protein
MVIAQAQLDRYYRVVVLVNLRYGGLVVWA